MRSARTRETSCPRPSSKILGALRRLWSNLSTVDLMVGILAALLAIWLTPNVQAWISVLATGPARSDNACTHEGMAAPALRPVEPEVSAPHILAINVKQSPVRSGCVDVEVVTRHEPADFTQALTVSGRYGTAGVSDVTVDRVPSGVTWSLDLPAQGECATWLRSTTRTVADGWAQRYTLPGLWGEHEYCLVASAAIDWSALHSADATRSEPACFSTTWNYAWGRMEFSPVTPDNASNSNE